jgi:hypothetical protein
MPSSKFEANKTWQLVEQHGLWWAYQGNMPPPEAFRTHGRPYHLPILGPYPSRKAAEALLRRDGRRVENQSSNA